MTRIFFRVVPLLLNVNVIFEEMRNFASFFWCWQSRFVRSTLTYLVGFRLFSSCFIKSPFKNSILIDFGCSKQKKESSRDQWILFHFISIFISSFGEFRVLFLCSDRTSDWGIELKFDDEVSCSSWYTFIIELRCCTYAKAQKREKWNEKKNECLYSIMSIS